MSIPNESLIRKLQRHSGAPEDYGFLCTMNRPEAMQRGTWTEYPYQLCDSTPEVPMGETDLFWSPLGFTTPKRSNQTVSGAGVLFADLDPVDPEGLDLRPTVAWSTSPGNYQGIWVLDGRVDDYDTWADLNHRLTVDSSADRGGWMGSKVLRVPGSANWKRRSFGELLWDDGPAYRTAHLDHALPLLAPAIAPTFDADDHPALPNPADRDYLVRLYWDRMTLRGRSMIQKDRVRDRSLHIVRCANELIVRGGLDPEAAFNLLWVQPWCKWRTDRHRPDQLWTECLAVAGE